MKRTKSFHESLISSLKDPVEAAAYLDAILKENDTRLFLAAMKDLADAHGGMAALSRRTGMNRGNLYKMLSKHGKPEVQSVENVLKAMGLRLSVVINGKSRVRRAA